MSSDIESLSIVDEIDLPSIRSYFVDSVMERLSASEQGWSWRMRDSIAGEKSSYLDWLKSQWEAGRWTDDKTIHNNARHFLDPRFARFMSLKYLSGSNSLGKSWPEVVKGYRELVGREARLRFADDAALAAIKVSKVGVEAYALQYFAQRDWECYTSATDHGNILTVQRSLPDSEYVFRGALSLASKSLLDHVDGWVSVVPASVDLRVVGGGPTSLVATSIAELLLPASTYYLTHDMERLRIVNAIAFFGTTLQAMSQCAPSPGGEPVLH